MNICSCGCKKEILFKWWHKYRQPRYLVGHHLKGIPFSPEHKRKIGISNLGKNLGRKHSKDTIAKFIQSNKGKPMPVHVKQKLIKSRKGTHHSLQSRQKISNSLLKKQIFTGFSVPLRIAIRNCEPYKKWRTLVFQRDNYTCQTCLMHSRDLEAHHKLPFHKMILNNNIKNLEEALICNELWDVNNGITLCGKCHTIIDIHRKRMFKKCD